VLDGFSCAILKAVQSDGDTPKAPAVTYRGEGTAVDLLLWP